MFYYFQKAAPDENSRFLFTTLYNWVIYIFMPLIVAAIGVPTTIMA